MGMMKTLSLGALLLFVVALARAANPAFQDLNQNQFNTTGNKVSIKSGSLLTNAEMHGVRSSDGTPGADAITGGVSFKDGFYVSGSIFGSNWVTNAISAVYSNGIVKGTNINALDLRRGPDVIFQVVSGAVQSVAATALIINDTGTGGLVRSNAPNLHAPTLDTTNLTTQIDAQIDAKGALLLQSSTNYANGVTNSSLLRQTQATALSNALVSFAYSIGANNTNFTLQVSNLVRLVAGLDATNHAAGILQAATNYANSVTNSSIFRQTQATALSNALIAYVNAASGGAVVTNANQFGPSVTLTLKDGVQLTNPVVYGSVELLGTGNGEISFLDDTTGKWFAQSVTNVQQSVTNVFVGTWPLAPGWCWQLQSTNNYIVRYTNGPCGGVATWTNDFENTLTAASVVDILAPGYRALASSGKVSYYNPGTFEMFDDMGNNALVADTVGLFGFTGPTLAFSVNGESTFPVYLQPAIADGYTPFKLDTPGVAHTFSNLLEVANNGTAKAWIDFDGALSLSGQTNRFGVSAAGLLLKDGVPLVPLYGSLANIDGGDTSAQIDFSPAVGTTHYQCTNLSGNLTLQITNLYTETYGPRDIWVYIETDGTPRNITVSTNGITTGTRVSWGFNSVTNGATSFTATNRVRLNLARNRAGVVSAAYEHQQ